MLQTTHTLDSLFEPLQAQASIGVRTHEMPFKAKQVNKKNNYIQGK
jgi:hypothetical protein